MRNAELERIYNRYVDDLYSYALHLGFGEDVIMDAIHDVFYISPIKALTPMK